MTQRFVISNSWEDMKWTLSAIVRNVITSYFVVGCEIGLRVGNLLKLKAKQILDLKGKQTRFFGSRKATRKKRSESLSVPVQKGRTPYSPTQAYRQVHKVTEFAGVLGRKKLQSLDLEFKFYRN